MVANNAFAGHVTLPSSVRSCMQIRLSMSSTIRSWQGPCFGRQCEPTSLAHHTGPWFELRCRVPPILLRLRQFVLYESRSPCVVWLVRKGEETALARTTESGAQVLCDQTQQVPQPLACPCVYLALALFMRIKPCWLVTCSESHCWQRHPTGPLTHLSISCLAH